MPGAIPPAAQAATPLCTRGVRCPDSQNSLKALCVAMPRCSGCDKPSPGRGQGAILGGCMTKGLPKGRPFVFDLVRLPGAGAQYDSGGTPPGINGISYNSLQTGRKGSGPFPPTGRCPDKYPGGPGCRCPPRGGRWALPDQNRGCVWWGP